MTRGISENEVHEAADAILSRGERPTIERIRAELGRGSPNTVNRHLDAWWSRLADRMRPGADRAPAEIVDLAAEVWRRVQPVAEQSVQRRMAEAATAAAERQARLEEAAVALEAERRAFSDARVQLDRRIGELEFTVAARDEALQAAQVTSGRLSEQLQEARAELAAARAQHQRAAALASAEISKLTERLEGNEKRLMERLASEKTGRHEDAEAAKRRIKALETELQSSRQQLQEQTKATGALQASFNQELQALRKVMAAPAKSGSKAAARAKARTKSRS